MVQAMKEGRAARAGVRVAALSKGEPVAAFDFELAVKILGDTKAVPLERFSQS
jgi:hypothetical protein